MPFYDVRCLSCGQEACDVLTGVYDVAPCGACGQPTERVWRSKASNVNGDECDIWQENGFRHPRHFTHKSDLKRALAEVGREVQVRHRTIPGTDKSPFTTDWSKGSIDAQTLKNAAELVARNGAFKGNDPELEPLTVKWQVRDVDPKTGPGPWRDCEAPR